MAEDSDWTHVELRFPLGSYSAQSTSNFAQPEWPPHPVRVLAALVAAAHSLPVADRDRARDAVTTLASCPEPPEIVAPRCDGAPDGRTSVAALRGASRWAPRNHELGELKNGIHPRELGRGRAAVEKGGIAIGDMPVSFLWPTALDSAALEALDRAAAEVTFLGTSRSPVLVTVSTTSGTIEEAAWMPTRRARPASVDVRVPTATLLATLDAQHERRKGKLRRDGAPARAAFVPPASLGRLQAYFHTSDLAREPTEPLDPRQWGEMLVLAVDRGSVVRPKAPGAFALARATRAAILAGYGAAGTADEAPALLTARGSDPHAAFVPLPFVGDPHADGRIIGVAIVLPHPWRAPDVLIQRRAIERGIRSLVAAPSGTERRSVGVPGIGNVLLGGEPARIPPRTLQPERWRRASRIWSSVTPVVHSRYQPNSRPESLLEQVTADCRDVGLPEPVQVEVLRVSRFHGAPLGISRTRLPEGWKGPLRGPTNHLELTFAEPVAGPVLLGKARHFGLGLCLPVEEARAG